MIVSIQESIAWPEGVRSAEPYHALRQLGADGTLVRASGKHGAEAQIQMRVVVAIAGETPALMRRRTQVQQSRARAIKSGLASAPAHGGDGVATSILIVDDSKLARIVVGKAIAAIRPDWERVEAGSAAEALELVTGREIDVVIVDYNMPGQNGLELAEELRRRRPDLPIAVATANVQDEIVARARSANAAFVPKPITEEKLRPFLEAAALKLRPSS